MTNGNFSLRLKEAMERKGVNGRQLAEETAATEATVSRYLSGARNPENFEILASIARFLEVSTDYLLGLTNNPYRKGSLPEEVKELLSRYLRASDSDKKVLWTLLDKYADGPE